MMMALDGRGVAAVDLAAWRSGDLPDLDRVTQTMLSEDLLAVAGLPFARLAVIAGQASFPCRCQLVGRMRALSFAAGFAVVAQAVF
jgi:hypothetical protein